MKKLFLLILIVISLRATPRVQAIACTGLPSIGNLTLTNCTLTVAGITGTDFAGNTETSTTNTSTLHLDVGASVTVNSGGNLIVGSVFMDGGTIAIASGGSVKPGSPLYVADADADGWASSFSTIYTATASGRRRLSLMRSTTSTDCGDANFNVANQCCAANGSACGSDGACCSAVCATNADADSYFSLAAGHTGTCQATALAYTDCYDANANVYPGSTYCGGTHRGDGSFDFNCDSISSKTGCTILNYSTVVAGNENTVSCIGPAGGRHCGNYVGHNYYNPLTTACGTYAATCAGSTGGLAEDCTDNGVTCSKASNGFSACTSLANIGNQACN